MLKILTISQIQFLIRQNALSYLTSLDGNVLTETTDNQSVSENVKIRKISRQDGAYVGVTSVRGKIKEPIRSSENLVPRNFTDHPKIQLFDNLANFRKFSFAKLHENGDQKS